MFEDQMNAKMKSEYDSRLCGATAPTPNSYLGDCCTQGNLAGRPYTMQEQAEKNASSHYELAQKQSQAAAFFRDNPIFDEFIRLVRSGAIQF